MELTNVKLNRQTLNGTAKCQMEQTNEEWNSQESNGITCSHDDDHVVNPDTIFGAKLCMHCCFILGDFLFFLKKIGMFSDFQISKPGIESFLFWNLDTLFCFNVSRIKFQALPSFYFL